MDSENKIVQITLAYCAEGDDARRARMDLSDRNRAAYDNYQDFSHKVEGQSREFLPETFQTVEQFSAFVKKGLTSFGDWFDIKLGKGAPISDESARHILMNYLQNMPEGTKTVSFPERLSDATKIGQLEAVMIFKTHGMRQKQTVYVENDGELETLELEPWKLMVDLVRNENFYQDPTGRGLYEIQEIERDLHHVKKLADMGVYSKSVLKNIENDFAKEEAERRNDNTKPKSYRRRIMLKECWGTIIDKDGTVLKENAIWTIANDKYLIRKPEENPYWHGQSPFDVIPLIRTPFSVWHKALCDAAVPLNYAMNELFNLMLDGGLASVWGIKQLRMDMLVDERQVAGGIPQGMTLAIRDDVPEGAKVLEQVTEGNVPSDAMAMFGLVQRQFQSASLTNEIKLGNIPQKQVKATEIVEADQSSDAMMDSIISGLEYNITRVIKKAWLNILQNADDLSSVDIDIPKAELLRFARMKPAQRFQTMANGAQIKVSGLSEVTARAKDLQRILALLQVGGSNPLLMRTFQEEISPKKLMNRLLKILNLNPTDLKRDEEEMARLPEDQANMERFGPGGSPVKPTGEPGQTSEINQNMNPTGGT